MISDPAILAANTIITNGFNNSSNESQKMNNLFAPEANENHDPKCFAQNEKSKVTTESKEEKFFLNKVSFLGSAFHKQL
jgi:hypothetical protein